MNPAKLLLCFFVISIYSVTAYSQQTVVYRIDIGWDGMKNLDTPEGTTLERPGFSGATFSESNNYLPLYTKSIDPDDHLKIKELRISDAIFMVMPPYDYFQGFVKDEVMALYNEGFDRKNRIYSLSLLPFRYNESNMQYEKLVSCNLEVIYDLIPQGLSLKSSPRINSVLSSGNWFKFGIQNTGVHILTYQNLKDAGVNPDNINPKNIRVFGYGGGMLPENPILPRYPDLPENSVFVSGEEDGKFDQQDYILFYARSPNSWSFSPLEGVFQHMVNLYSDMSYVFLTTDLGPGKRISNSASLNLTPNYVSSKFNDYYFHESETYNLIKSGKTWYGEVFDLSTTWEKSITIPNLDLGSAVVFKADVAARSSQGSSFEFYVNNNLVFNLPVSSTSGVANSNYARTASDSKNIEVQSQVLNIKIEYNKYIQNAIGWLNYFELNYIRNLGYTGPQMAFRDVASASQGNITRFTISNMQSNIQVWNVTDPVNPLRQSYNLEGNNANFVLKTDTLLEFVAFDGSGYYSPVFTEKIQNQDLHGIVNVDMIILSPPVFMQEAERVANLHSTNDDLNVRVIDPSKIYNEFSSGAQDLTAIRDFMKYLYENSDPGQEPKYLLLFGDGSYDYKDRIQDNTNFIPSWQSTLTLNPVDSYTTDDFYGFLDHAPNDNIIDLGIGRLPVATIEQAGAAVDKIISYGLNSQKNMDNWRTDITLIGDDEDSNIHLNDAEDLYVLISMKNPDINVDKIYLDAYRQYLTSSGQRYPDVNTSITNKVEKGSLIINYVGHGGEAGLAHEQVLVISDINNWSNPDHLPVFLTATCEFSKYDDPGRVSAGEFVFLNPGGGAISLFSTTRATFAGGNSNLNKSFYNFAFNADSQTRMGDIIRQAKAQSGYDTNGKKFILLGDPALKLALPENDIVITKINGNEVSAIPDTLKALSAVTIEGEIRKPGGGLMSEFDGVISCTVFDKPVVNVTLANDPSSYAQEFMLQKNTLFRGKTDVTDGKFQISFIVPKDIAFSYGNGKISLYASSVDLTDASGSFYDFIVGGFSNEIQTDFSGPDIHLYMNDDNFNSGAVTDNNPTLLAMIEDESGINTVGNGIGHDIVAYLDNNSERPFVLNDFYEGDIYSSSRGKVSYPFRGLKDGPHTLTLRAWDIYNNSNSATITFHVVSDENIVINSLMNFPNPFISSTKFSFEHNQAGKTLDVSIQIFNLQGSLVKTLYRKTDTEGYRYISEEWNGCGETGERLLQGMYIFRVTVGAGGKVASKSEKLVVIN